jgi:hypothetical protein
MNFSDPLFNPIICIVDNLTGEESGGGGSHRFKLWLERLAYLDEGVVDLFFLSF